MERIFTNKSIWKKIVIVILVIMAFQTIFSMPRAVYAVDEEDDAAPSDGDNLLYKGILMRPIMSLIVTLGDGVMNLLHHAIMGQDITIVTVDKATLWEKFIALLAFVLIVLMGAGLIYLGVVYVGPALSAFGTLAKKVVAAVGWKAIVATAAGAVVCGVAVAAECLPDTFKLPIYSYSPEEIFKGDILLFNLDFFDTTDYEIMVCCREVIERNSSNGNDYVDSGEPATANQQGDEIGGLRGWLANQMSSTGSSNPNDQGQTTFEARTEEQKQQAIAEVDTATTGSESGMQMMQNLADGKDSAGRSTSKYTLGAEHTDTYENYVNGTVDGVSSKELQLQYCYYVPDGKSDTEENRIKTSTQNSAKELRRIIGRWYAAIRNICIVLMLSILVYIGIRMMLTSVSSEKAKYKEMIRDWLVGLCLLFIMHYIMAFSVTIVEKITDVVNTTVETRGQAVSIPDEYDGHLIEAVQEMGLDGEGVIDEANNIVNYPTNLMGKMRIMMQIADNAQNGTYVGYVVCFLVLVIFTLVFTFTYLKRLLYMAFLTLISPMVAMTYCIDKTNDGQAQGFNTWLKEYIFNLLIQPMHLLLYYILVVSAYELAGTNIIYSLVALGFMIPAEKLLRSMFGFEKAKTPPLLGGPLGTSLMMQGLNRLSSIGRGGSRGDEGERKTKDSIKEARAFDMPTLAGTKDGTPDEGRRGRHFAADAGAGSGDSSGDGARTGRHFAENMVIDGGSNNIVTGVPQAEGQGTLFDYDDNGEIRYAFNNGESTFDDGGEDSLSSQQPELLDDEGGNLDPSLSGQLPLTSDVVDEAGVDAIEDEQIDLVDDAGDMDSVDPTLARPEPISSANLPGEGEEETLQIDANPSQRGNSRSAAAQRKKDARQRKIDEMNQWRKNLSGETYFDRYNKRRKQGIEDGKLAAQRLKDQTKAGAKAAVKSVPKRIAKKTFKFAKGAAVAAPTALAIGTLGAAAAVASGEAKNVATAAGTAAGTGYVFGRRAANTKASSFISAETRAAFQAAGDNEKYKSLDKKAKSVETRADTANRTKVENAFENRIAKEELDSRAKARQTEYNASIQQARDEGKSDQEIKRMELEHQRQEKEAKKADKEELVKKSSKDFMEDDGELDTMLQHGIDLDRALVLKEGIKKNVYADVEEAMAMSDLYDGFGQKNPQQMGNKFTDPLRVGLSKELGDNKEAVDSRLDYLKDGVSFLYKGLH